MSVRPISAISQGGARVSDRLAEARGRRFVGRNLELELFRSALDAAEPPFVVMHVHGPGGIGKTTLIQQFVTLAEKAGRTPLRLDLREVDPSIEVFCAMLGQALQAPRGGNPAQLAELWPHDAVLFIDNYDPDSPLDAWLRGDFLPRLPAHALMITAGRKTPVKAWSTDLEWAALSRTIALRNLEPEDSRAYLSRRGVSEPRQREILASTFGHPLALSLAADAVTRCADDRSFELTHETDLVSALLTSFLDQPPSPRHRMALHACAAAHVLTEPLLAAALEGDARDMFEWLGGLPFIESGPQGLRPHDLAREVLYADLRHCSLDQRRMLNGRLLGHLYGGFLGSQGIDQQRWWLHCMYLQRYNPAMAPYFEWTSFTTQFSECARPEDVADIVEMTRRHEGDESAAIAAYWLRRQPEAFLSFRNLTGELLGYMATLRLEQVTEEDRRVDPSVDKIREFVARHAPAREGEVIHNIRFAMGREGHQTNKAMMNMLGANSSIGWTSTPRLAWGFCSVAAGGYFTAMFDSLQIHRAAEADFEVGGRRYEVFGHDWRVETAEQWMMVKVDRASRYEHALAPAMPPLLVLSAADFDEAVAQALRDYARPEALARNPLLRTRLLARKPDVESLRSLLAAGVASLDASPKDRKSLLALRHTWIEPEITQEQVAERLGMPFNTYRYQLARGTKAVTQWLWRREIGED